MYYAFQYDTTPGVSRVGSFGVERASQLHNEGGEEWEKSKVCDLTGLNTITHPSTEFPKLIGSPGAF